MRALTCPIQFLLAPEKSPAELSCRVKDRLTPEERLARYHRLSEEFIFQLKKLKSGLKASKVKNSSRLQWTLKNIKNSWESRKVKLTAF